MHRSIALIDKSLIPEFLEHPPYGFHIVTIHGSIGMLHICPPSDARNNPFPLGSKFQNFRSAKLIEFRDAKRFDIFLMFNVKFFLCNILYRQTMTIPSPFPLNLKPAHRPIPRHSILQDIPYNVTIVRCPSCKGRSIIKSISRRSLAICHRLLKYFFLLPKVENLFLHLWQIHLRINFFKHRRLMKNKKSSTQSLRQGRPKYFATWYHLVSPFPLSQDWDSFPL